MILRARRGSVGSPEGRDSDKAWKKMMEKRVKKMCSERCFFAIGFSNLVKLSLERPEFERKLISGTS